MLNTFTIIAEQSFLYVPLVLGAYISLSLLKIPDLSLESAYVFGAILGAKIAMLLPTMPLPLLLFSTCFAAVVGGQLVGMTSSCITRLVGIPHLLSSIITAGIFHGINQFVLGGAYLSLNTTSNPLELYAIIPQHPEFMALGGIALCLIFAGMLFFKTQLSYAYAIYGNNALFFSNYNINTNYIFITGVMLANGLAGLAGFLFAQSNGFVEINIGIGKVLLCITALIMGKTMLQSKKHASVMVPVAGVSLYFLVQQLLLKTGFNLTYFTMVQALIVLLFLMVTYRKNQSLPDNLGV